MRHLIIGLLLLSHGGIAAQDRPNVILVLTDDQGYGDLASQGNPFIQTPHLDRFYTESVRLTDFHVDPVCTPTRAANLSPQKGDSHVLANVRTPLHPAENRSRHSASASGPRPDRTPRVGTESGLLCR